MNTEKDGEFGRKSVFLAVFTVLALLLASFPGSADARGKDDNRDKPRYEHNEHRSNSHQRWNRSDHRWNRSDHRWGYVYRGRPAFGLRFAFLPYGAVSLTFGNGRYYYHEGMYYERIGREYVTVLPPVGLAPVGVVAAGANVFVVNVPYVYGGYRAVTLNRSGAGFVGPQGEFYAEFPQVAQLTLMYGR